MELEVSLAPAELVSYVHLSSTNTFSDKRIVGNHRSFFASFWVHVCWIVISSFVSLRYSHPQHSVAASRPAIDAFSIGVAIHRGSLASISPCLFR
jgi:hypothetical protein